MIDMSHTRTSRRWTERPGGWDACNLRAVFPAGNSHGIPDLPLAVGIPERLVAYGSRTVGPPATGTHFFLDDYRFESVWRRPEQMVPRMRRATYALTPDFSMWMGAPPAVQVWQTYRSRWCGAWWALHGISVIPTVTWAGPDTFAFAFAGIPRRSVVAVSSVGILLGSATEKLSYARGFHAMTEAVRPAAVLMYGRTPPILMTATVPIREYPAERRR